MPAFIQLAAHPLRWQLITALSTGDYRVRELVARTNQPQNLISYHLRLLRDSGLITSTRSSRSSRDSYYHLNLQHCADQLAAAGPALHPGLQMTPSPPAEQLDASASVLFVCTGNSARSAIAEALLRHLVRGRLHVTSAGTKPRNSMHANISRVLRQEYGIDIAGQRPRHLDRVDTADFTHIITLCDKARENCPDFNDHPGHLHWSIPDPVTADDHDSYPHFSA
ncbi:ArsR family transcriptional regulator [Mycobacterium sp.]|uniref:arsenate reductase/protein-tyrosine-phosphatase family protein n=1 Tax=Mycobacterium sp. TaxID=1785 RepID=UPI0031E4784B